MKLTEVIKKHGISNLRFLVNMKPIRTYFGLISMTSSSDPDILMLCEIVEDKHKISDNYKITLQSIDQIDGLHGREHYYISDLEMMIEQGSVKVLHLIDMK